MIFFTYTHYFVRMSTFLATKVQFYTQCPLFLTTKVQFYSLISTFLSVKVQFHSSSSSLSSIKNYFSQLIPALFQFKLITKYNKNSKQRFFLVSSSYIRVSFIISNALNVFSFVNSIISFFQNTEYKLNLS